jgi:hypothetical protein
MAGEPSEESQSNALEGRYANLFKVGFNDVEFVLEFGQEYEGGKPRIHTRVITSSAYVENLLKLLGDALESYRRGYGGWPNARDRGA